MKRDSDSMKTIAAVTLFFLPMSTVAVCAPTPINPGFYLTSIRSRPYLAVSSSITTQIKMGVSASLKIFGCIG
jgi:hypothetical protein